MVKINYAYTTNAPFLVNINYAYITKIQILHTVLDDGLQGEFELI